MKLLRGAIILLAVISLAAIQAKATTYSDSTGEATVGGQLGAPGSQILDITSVEVNNNATDLIFKINLSGDPTATDWGKYCIGIDSVSGGDTAGDGWARPISMSSGMDYWVGSWADSGNGAELYKYNAGWSLLYATYTPSTAITFSKDTSSVTITLTLADLGLAPGNSFYFDVYTSGGGGTDSAVDALANPNQSIANWGDAYDSGALVDLYNIPAIPEPSTLVLAGFGGLLLVQRLFRRRS